MGEDVKRHEGGRVLRRQGRDLAWRVDEPSLQEVEVQPGAVPDDRFTVEDRARLELVDGCGGEVREPVGEVLALPGPQSGAVVVSHHGDPIAVPLQLVDRSAPRGAVLVGIRSSARASATSTGPRKSDGRMLTLQPCTAAWSWTDMGESRNGVAPNVERTDFRP